MANAAMKRRVLLVGLDGATPGIVSPLIDTGALPHLRRIVENGCVGTLNATPPLVRSMAWTTLATGVQASRHGICGDVAVRPDGAGVDRAGHRSWRARAMWEHLTAAGYACVTLGWPASAPAASWKEAGVLVDDSFVEPLGPGFDAWPLLPDCVLPDDFRDALRQLRVHPGDITGEQIAGLVPDAWRVDQESDPRLTRIALALARSSTVHAAATYLAAEHAWDFLAVAYPLLADIQRELLPLRPPQLPGADDLDVQVHGPVVDAAYRLQDAMLGRLLEVAAGSAITVVVVSPYGFAAGPDRPPSDAVSQLPASIAWHRTPGWLAAMGDGVQHDALVHGARIHDLAPTVLDLFALRCPEHEGRCIEGMSRSVAPARVISLPPRDDALAIRAPDAFDDLDLEPLQRKLVQDATIAWEANAAEAHLAVGEYAAAAQAYQAILQLAPGDWLAKARLARCCLHLGDAEKCRSLAAEVIAAKPDMPWGYLLGAAGRVLDGQAAEAGALLAQAHETGRDMPNVSLRLGLLHLLCLDFARAESLFREALQRMPRSVEAHDGLGCALHAQGRHQEAVAALRSGVGCVFHYPLAHLHLAMALVSLGEYSEAAASVRTALEQDAAVQGGQALLERITSVLGGKIAAL